MGACEGKKGERQGMYSMSHAGSAVVVFALHCAPVTVVNTESLLGESTKNQHFSLSHSYRQTNTGSCSCCQRAMQLTD